MEPPQIDGGRFSMRNLEPDDAQVTLSRSQKWSGVADILWYLLLQVLLPVLDDWWGRPGMALMLPRLFFAHFRDTSFVLVDHDQVTNRAPAAAVGQLIHQNMLPFFGIGDSCLRFPHRLRIPEPRE